MISRFVANLEKCRKYTFLGGSAQIITILQLTHPRLRSDLISENFDLNQTSTTTTKMHYWYRRSSLIKSPQIFEIF